MHLWLWFFKWKPSGMSSIILLQKNGHCLLLWSIIIFPKHIKCWGKYRIVYDFRNSWEFPGILRSHLQIPKIAICWEFGNSLKLYFCNISRLCIPPHPQDHCSDGQTLHLFWPCESASGLPQPILHVAEGLFQVKTTFPLAAKPSLAP